MKISVITVTYNSEETLEDTIKSVSFQSYKNVEHIVMDGGSTDATLSILDANREKLSIVVSEPDDGIYDAYNKALTYASGDVIAILNSDDVFYNSDVLTKVASEFKNNACDIVFGDLVLVDEGNLSSVIRYWKSSKFILGSFKDGWHPPHPSFFVKNEVYQTCGNFDISLAVSADFELMLRLMEVCKCEAVYVPQVLTRMRVGGHSQNIMNIMRGGMSIMHAFEKNGMKIHPLLYFMKRYLAKLKQVFLNRDFEIEEINFYD